ncbi:MAG: response regulator transcription factor [Francisellaceae bacterium]
MSTHGKSPSGKKKTEHIPEHFLELGSKLTPFITPLFQKTGLSTLVYQRKYADGSEIRLSNRIDWLEYYYANRLYVGSLFEKPISDYRQEFVLWQAIADKHRVIALAKAHDIDHGLTYINPRKDYVEQFFMGGPNDKPETINRVINNLTFIDEFSCRFVCHAETLIKEAESRRIYLHQKDNKPTDTLEKLSRREIDIARILLLGASAKEIGLRLHISYRTVESHINNLKQKLHCKRRSELIQCLYMLGIRP